MDLAIEQCSGGSVVENGLQALSSCTAYIVIKAASDSSQQDGRSPPFILSSKKGMLLFSFHSVEIKDLEVK
jgi:hypothetical protein